MNNREFRERMAALVAQQRRAAYEGKPAEPAPAADIDMPISAGSSTDQKPATKKPPAKETRALKTRRSKA